MDTEKTPQKRRKRLASKLWPQGTLLLDPETQRVFLVADKQLAQAWAKRCWPNWGEDYQAINAMVCVWDKDDDSHMGYHGWRDFWQATSQHPNVYKRLVPVTLEWGACLPDDHPTPSRFYTGTDGEVYIQTTMSRLSNSLGRAWVKAGSTSTDSR